MQNMRILKIFLFLLYYKEISIDGRTIYGRYKGRTSNARSSYTPGSSDRKLNLGSKSFSGFKRPDGLSSTQKPATVKPQGLSLSSNNARFSSLKGQDTIIKTSIKESSGLKFDQTDQSKITTSGPAFPAAGISTLNSSKNKFVNGGNRNPDVKIEGNMSIGGPSLSSLLGLSASASKGPVQKKQFTPSAGRISDTGTSSAPQKRYGAFDTAASAPSIAQTGFQHDFGASSMQGQARSEAYSSSMSAGQMSQPVNPNPYDSQGQPTQIINGNVGASSFNFNSMGSNTMTGNPMTASTMRNGANSISPQGGDFQMPTFQNNAYPGQSSAPVSNSMNRFDNMDRFGSIPNQPEMQTLINQAQPALTNHNQAPNSNQGMPQWSGGGNWNIPPPPSNNEMAPGNTMSSFGQLPSNGQPSYSQPIGSQTGMSISNSFPTWEGQQSEFQSQLASSGNSLNRISNLPSVSDIQNDSSLTPLEKLEKARARMQMQKQSESNRAMAQAADSSTFISRYATGPQQSAGFDGMHDSNRNTLGHQNSYSSQDIRSQNMKQRHEGVQEHYKPPEVKTTGNPFNVEVQDQWEGETAGATFYQMDDKDRQEFKNKNPDQWVDLDGDGVLDFDPDMPVYPAYKFFTETRWESDTNGGYIGIIYVPVTRDVDGWSMTLKFSLPIKLLENWEYQPLKQSPSDGVTAILHNDHWNGVRVEGTYMRCRMMVEYDRTPGTPPGIIPQPAVALLGTIFYPDGSRANYDEGVINKPVTYEEGFSGLPKPEGASSSRAYVDPNEKRNETPEIKWQNERMFTNNVRSSRTFNANPYAPIVTTAATTTRKLSANIVAGIAAGPTQASFSGNLGKFEEIYNARNNAKEDEDLEMKRIMERIGFLESKYTADNIQNAFGQIRTTMETSAPPPTTQTTRRSLSQCEKRQIAEKHRCKEDTCFRHQCLKDGHFSPGQCWPKINLCWCVTIKGMKLNTTLRPMLKFNPTRCDDLYDPQGLREQNNPELTVMGMASASASVIGQPIGDVGTLVKSASPATTAAPTTTQRPKLKHYARHDWAQVIRLSTEFYAAQESGKLREDNPVSWKMSSHESDGRPCGMDLSGGYYDSGDFMKYTFPLAWTMTVLAWSAMEHESVLKEVGVWDKYVQVIEHGVDWLMKANPEDRELVAVVGDPSVDHQFWGRPQDQRVPRPCMKISRYSPGTDLAAEVAAALAAGSKVISDKRKADLAWLKAKSLYDFGDKHRGKYSKVVSEVKGYYESDDYTDELAWGAIWLMKASKLETDKTKYMNRAKSAYKQFQLGRRVKSFSWDQKHAGVQLLMAELTGESQYRAHVIAFCDYNMPHGGAKFTPGGLLFIEKWGALRHAMNIAYICLRTSVLSGMDAIRQANYRNFALAQLDYILGVQGRSFLVGYGKNFPDRPHHRAASCSLVGECGWDAYRNDVPNPQVLLGALVGGPDEFDVFVNNRTDYIRNEVALDYNAGITAISALMLDLERGNVG